MTNDIRYIRQMQVITDASYLAIPLPKDLRDTAFALLAVATQYLFNNDLRKSEVATNQAINLISDNL